MGGKGDGGGGQKMVGFMFGNVDKKGKLDEDYLEEEAKENIDALDGRIEPIAEEKRGGRASGSKAGTSGGARAGHSSLDYGAPVADTAALERHKAARGAELDEDEDYDMEEADGEEEAHVAARPKPAAKPSRPAQPAADSARKQPSLKRKKRLSFREPPKLPIRSEVEGDDLLSLLKVDRASMEEEMELRLSRRSEDGGDGSAGSLTQEDAFETAMDGVAATTFEQDQGDHTYSRFRPGVPLMEAFREKAQSMTEEASNLTGTGTFFNLYNNSSNSTSFASFQPVLNENWEKGVDWDESDSGERGPSAEAGDPGSQDDFLAPIWHPPVENNKWEAEIRWDSEEDNLNRQTKDRHTIVCLDLEDPSVIIEEIGEAGNQGPNSREGGAGFDWAALSNDEYYIDKKKQANNSTKSNLSQKARHSAPALKMISLRLTETMTKQELRCLHRPSGSFIPKKNAPAQSPALKFHGSYHVNARLRSLVGYDYSIPQAFVANATTVEDLWKTAKQLQPRLQKAFKMERPKLMISAMKKMKPLKSQSLLGEGDTGLQLKGDITFWIITNKVTLIPNTNYKEFKEPHRPPGAFKSMRDLSIRDGHLFLFEYVEEHPLLLSNQGMGMRLLSFYRKQDKRDETWKSLKVPKVRPPQDGSWGKYGRVIPLEDTDDPPFLGDVMKGQHMLGVDCNLFRAPAFYHPVQSTDFLLIRSSLGRWMIREVTGTLAIGQQEPRVKTPWPGSVQIREFEEKRFQDYVFRTLKKKIKEQAAGRNVLPELQVQGLKFLFPNNSEQLIRNRLRNLCNCVPVNQAQADGRWSLKPGARIPEEVELRHRLTPEMVCAYESMRSSQERYAMLGMKRHELLRVSNERLKLATELLPGGEQARAAAKFIEQMIQVASWAMVTNFLDVMKDGRGAFTINGLGDPSGRGRCISFVKTHGRGMGVSEGTKKPTVIAGTKTDLRRLSMGKAEEILKSLGVPKEEIKLLTRWNRINLIQRLSSAAQADGSKLGDKYGGFARSHRQSAAESQRIYQAKCQDVFNKQVLALSEAQEEEPDKMEVDGEEEEGDDLANELENMLDDDDDEEEDENGKTEAELLEEDKEEMKRLKEEGLFGEKKKKGKEKGAAKEKEKPKNAAPKRRLRRIFKRVMDDGTMETEEVIITDPHQIETLRLARANFGGVGEGGGVINLTKERKKLQDRHLKLKKRIIKQKKQLMLMKDAGEKVEISAAAAGPSGAGASGTTKLKLKAEGTGTGKFKLKVSKKSTKKKKLSPVQRLNRLIKEKIHMPIRKMPISKPFATKVDVSKIKDYEDFVHEQITLGEISKHLHKNQYTSWMGYQADITRLVENARAYNDPDSGGLQKNPNLAQQAEFLQILINLRIARYASGIIEAQERCEPLLVALRSKYNDELPWVECSKCNKWRLVSFEEHQRLQATPEGEEMPWFCEMNEEREDPICEDQDDEEHFNNLKAKYLIQ
ncbi:transcription initiation factor TFIID [Chloropicon primus]|uniref:Transcription initiation factor TFIID subunit 1 n=3 Tax=Chloropicon primus TaxID=1764295 RepID=A0A5B8MV68_9CHLO|nr:transcription initiation factor TFIID [Chloropicon primus]UPR02747.1 transcription initiation factor TFIID [Chloropicon primus]|eukprot:QDZ23535.1 transcription initiation factor TFIID [Chloropicon primus]